MLPLLLTGINATIVVLDHEGTREVVRLYKADRFIEVPLFFCGISKEAPNMIVLLPFLQRPGYTRRDAMNMLRPLSI